MFEIDESEEEIRLSTEYEKWLLDREFNDDAFDISDATSEDNEEDPFADFHKKSV